MGGNPADSVSRRSFVKYSGAAGVTGALAGCSSNGGDGGDGSDGGDGGDGGSGGGGDGSDGGDAPDEVIIGSNHPLSGALSNTGERMDQAVRLAAMMKNESGGIESLDGAELSVISGDNEGAQELGGEVAQELIDDGASVLTGCYSSPVTSAATRTSESAGVPFVISVSVANSILRETQLNYAYRPQPPADQMAIDHARLLADTIRNAGEEIETAGLFYIDISFGQSIRDALREELPANDIEIVAETAYEPGDTADTQVTSLRDADPDAVIATTYRSGTIELVNAMDNQNYQPDYVTGCSNAAMNDISALEEMGGHRRGRVRNQLRARPDVRPRRRGPIALRVGVRLRIRRERRDDLRGHRGHHRGDRGGGLGRPRRHQQCARRDHRRGSHRGDAAYHLRRQR